MRGYDLGGLEFEIEVLGLGMNLETPWLLLLLLICLHLVLSDENSMVYCLLAVEPLNFP